MDDSIRHSEASYSSLEYPKTATLFEAFDAVPLRYGAVVFLTFSDYNGENYFASCGGFHSTKLCMKSQKDFLGKNKLRKGLFRIYPAFFNTEYLKVREKWANVAEAKSSGEVGDIKIRNFSRSLHDHCLKLDEEITINETNWAKVKGQEIKYGSVVQLMHVNSNKYLKYNSDAPAFYEPDNFAVSLSEEYSEATSFRISPCYSFSSENNGRILSRDQVFMVSLGENTGSRPGNRPHIHVSKKFTVNGRSKLELNGSTEKRSAISLQIYSDFQDDESDILKVGDKFWISFPEMDLSLVIDLDQENDSPFFFHHNEALENQDHFIGRSNGLFSLEYARNRLKGGPVKWIGDYILKSTSANRYLRIGETPYWDLDDHGPNEILRSLELTANPNNATRINLEQVPSTISTSKQHEASVYVFKDSYFRLKCTHENVSFYLHEFTGGLKAFKWVPVFNSLYREQKIFKFHSAQNKELTMTSYLMSSKSTIQKVMPFLSPNYCTELNIDKHTFGKFSTAVQRLRKCLKDLAKLCVNEDEAYLDIDQHYGAVNPMIQLILREQHFVELMITILMKAGAPRDLEKIKEALLIRGAQKAGMHLGLHVLSDYCSSSIKSQERRRNFEESVRQKLLKEVYYTKGKICGSVYNLLGKIALENPQNQSFIYSFIDLFKIHSEFIPESTECIEAVICQNEVILLNLRKEEVAQGKKPSSSKNKGSPLRVSTGSNKEIKRQKLVEMKRDSSKTGSEEAKEEKEANPNWSNEKHILSEVKRIALEFYEAVGVKQKGSSLLFYFLHLIGRSQSKEVIVRITEFLTKTCCFEGNGVNANQERLFEYVEDLFPDLLKAQYYSIEVKPGNQLCYQSNQIEESEINPRVVDLAIKYSEDWAEIKEKLEQGPFGGTKKPLPFKKCKRLLLEHGRDETKAFLVIQTLFNFLSALNLGRNHNWKHFIERQNIVTYQAIINSVRETQVMDLSGCLLRLARVLFVDQEPRSIKILPNLCKIFKKENKLEVQTPELFEPLSTELIKKRRNSIQKDINLSGLKSSLEEWFSVLDSKLDEVPCEYLSTKSLNYSDSKCCFIKWHNEIYSKEQLEKLALLIHLMKSGEYNFQVKESHRDFRPFSSSSVFSDQPKSLLGLLEFHGVFPESRKLLEAARKFDKSKHQKDTLNSLKKGIDSGLKMVGDFFNIENEMESQNSAKETQSFFIASGQFEPNDTFLRQNSVFKKLLFHAVEEPYSLTTQIKSQICVFFNFAIDYIVDFYLNQIVHGLESHFIKLAQTKKDIFDNLNLLSEEFESFIGKELDRFLPPIHPTGTSLDQELPSPKDESKGPGISLKDLVSYPVFPSLIQLLCLNNDRQLHLKIIQLIIRAYNMRNEIVLTLPKLLILMTPEHVAFYQRAKMKSQELLKLTEESEKWLTNKSKGIEEASLLNVKELLESLSRMLLQKEANKSQARSRGSLQFDALKKEIKEEKEYKEESDINYFFTEKGKKAEAIRVGQDILIYLQVHELAISLIRDSVFMLEGLDLEISIANSLQEMFRMAYCLLMRLARNNLESQNTLANYFSVYSLAIDQDLGQTQLLCEIFRENKKMCLEKQMKAINELVIPTIKCLGRRPEFLEFFEIIQKNNGEFLITNQKVTINSLLRPDILLLMLYVWEKPQNAPGTPPSSSPTRLKVKGKTTLDINSLANRKQSSREASYGDQSITSSLKFDREFDFVKRISMEYPETFNDVPYKYHQKLVRVLYKACVGKTGLLLNESRLREKLGNNYILTLLLSGDTLVEGFNPANGKPRDYMMPPADEPSGGFRTLNKVVDSARSVKSSGSNKLNPEEEEDIESAKNGLKIELLNYIYFVMLESEKLDEEMQRNSLLCINFIIQETRRLEYFVSSKLTKYHPLYPKYLLQKVTRLIIYYYTSFYLKLSFEQKELISTEIGSVDVTTILSEFLFYFGKAINRFDRSEISRKSRNAAKQLKTTLKELNIGKKTFSVLDIGEQEAEEEKLTKSLPGLFSKLSLDGWEGIEIDNEDAASIGIELRKEESRTPNQIFWKEFVQQFSTHELVEKSIRQERTFLAKAIFRLGDIYKMAEAVQRAGGEKVQKNSVKEMVGSKEVMRSLIQTVRSTSIEDASVSEKNLLVEILRLLSAMIPISEDESIPDQEKLIVSRQNFLNDNLATVTMLNLLSTEATYMHNSLLREIFILMARMLAGGNRHVQKRIFQYFHTNHSSEFFFEKIHSLIQKFSNLVKKDEIESLGDLINLVKLVLEMLQQFVEGHYLELQKFMQKQSTNFHTFDIINDMIDLLGALMRNQRSIFFECMIQTFDTLTEYIQGPCKLNQQVLIQGSFLGVAALLLEIDENLLEATGHSSRKQSLMTSSKEEYPYLERWMIAKLKYKCSITLISLLESSSDDIIFLIIKTLQLDIIKRCITDIYHQYKETYKGKYTEELFEHFEFTPDKEHSKAYCSFIIQTGFNLFIILETYNKANQTNDISEIRETPEGEENEQDDRAISPSESTEIIKNAIKKTMFLGRQSFASVKSKSTKLLNNSGNSRNIRGSLIDSEYMQEEREIKRNLRKTRSQLYPEALAFYQKYTSHVEVLRAETNIEQTYFYKLPYFFSLTIETKKEFERKVNRISCKTKVNDLQKRSKKLIRIMKFEYRVNKYSIIRFLTFHMPLLKDLAFSLAIVINILVVVYFKGNSLEGPAKTAVDVLGSFLVVLGALFMVFMVVKSPHRIIKAWRRKGKTQNKLSGYITRIIKVALSILGDFFLIYYICYAVCAILGLVFKEFFYAYHLFDILVREPVLVSVLKSIWIPKQALALTFVLFWLLVYMFTLIAYQFFRSHFEIDDVDYCKTVLNCLLTIFDKSFKDDGGIGSFMIDTENVDIFRFIYDNAFFLSLMIIMINIVSGIIIDTFGSIREEDKRFNEDVNNTCFICGLDRETLDKASEQKHGFKIHTTDEHNLWEYLYYIAYIHDKPTTEYTGIESYVSDKLAKRDNSWFPCGQALALKGQTSQAKFSELMNTLQKISEDQEAFLDHAVELKSSINEFKKTKGLENQEFR